MKIINAGYEILTPVDGIKELQLIEKAARVCYKSEDKITEDGESAKKIIAMLISKGHEAMLEHSMLTVKFIVDRGVSHELVRHRIASWAQESTRYCNYGKTGEITFIKPLFFEDDGQAYTDWEEVMENVERIYLDLIEQGRAPQEARSILPNSTKTEVIMTACLS